MTTTATTEDEVTGRIAPAVWLLGAGAFAIGTDTFVVAGVLPTLARDLEVSVAQAGQTITVFALSFGLLAPVIAATTARVPRRTLHLIALLVFAAGNLAGALAPTLGVLLATRVLAAAGAAAYTPAAAGAAAMLVAPARRGRALAIVLGGTTVATVAGVPVLSLVGNTVSWRMSFGSVALVAVLLCGALALWLPALPSPPIPSLRQRLQVLADRQVLPVVLTTLLFSVGGFAVYSYVAEELQRAAGATTGQVSALLLVFGIGGFLGNWGGGRLTDRVGAERLLMVGLLVFAVALAAFSTVARTVPVAAVCLLVWSAAAWSLTVPQQHRLFRLAPQAPTVAIGLNSAAMFLGMGFSGLVGGAVLAWGDAGSLGLVGAALVLIALAITVVQIRRTRSAAGQAAG